MKKNTVLYLVVFLALAVTATILVLKKSESTLPKALTDFAVKDTAAITRIHLTDHYKNDIVLERKPGGTWIVNKKYKVQQNLIELLLQTIKEITVKNPVPIPARDNYIKDLAVNGIKIEIYDADNLVKAYFVGSSTADDEGTIMVIQGSSEPFVTHIPGFVGYLTPRYITKEQDWRSSELYHLNPSEISEVEVDYPISPEQSFTLKVEGGAFMVSKPGSNTSTVKIDPLLAKKYLVGFRAINYESFPQMSSKSKDSIAASAPYALIKVRTNTGNMPVLKIYPKQADIKTKDISNGNIDMNRFYAINGENNKEILMVQTYVVGKIMAGYVDLTTGKAKTGQ